MTMDLTGPGGDRHYTLPAWGMLLDLAVRGGWRPAGAVEPEDEEGPEDDGEEGSVLEVDAADHQLPAGSALGHAIVSLFPSADNPLLMSYFYNCGFRVTPEDARALADALERALPDVPDHDAMEHKTYRHPGMPGVRLVNVTTPVSPFEWFGGKHELLRDFIGYCRQGGFEIW